MAARSLRSLALAMSAVGTLVLTQGCVDDGVSLHVICPIVPTIDTDSCVWDPGSGACVDQGILNLANAVNYHLNLRVDSGLKARARDVPPMGEPNGLQIESARIELRVPTGEVFGDPFNVAAAGYIPPAGSAAVNVELVSHALIAALTGNKVAKYPQMIASIKLKGKTNGQVTVESGEYLWPFQLIYQDLKKSSNTCLDIPFCVGSLGTDNFAYSCTD